MRRMIGALAVGLIATTAARAHFPFVLPAADGSAVQVVFSDELKPDTQVNVEKIAATKLTVRDAAGKETALELKKGEGAYDAPLPGSGPRTVYGITDYGVLQKGDAKPFRLVYYPKALVGTAAARAVGGPLKLEIVPAGAAGKTRFQVLAEGKPAADVEVTVLTPGGTKSMAKTDQDGLTPAFADPGRYGVYARHTEPKGGEHAGKKYDETRHYATLVVDIK